MNATEEEDSVFYDSQMKLKNKKSQVVGAAVCPYMHS
jgi:hypothetical protein